MSDAIELPTPLDELVERTKSSFVKTFGRTPVWIVAAPGRVNMIGDHVDYNRGFVLPFTIDRYTIVAGDFVSDSASSHSTIHSAELDQSFTVDLRSPIVPMDRGWSNYVKGVFHGFLEREIELPPMNMLIHSSVPTGSGLSSSAALEVAIATMLELATGVTLDKKEKALLCQKAEHEFANVPCGIMDQFVSVFGQEGSMLLLDCDDLSTRQIAFDDNSLALLVINSNVQHALAESEYSLRRKQCDSAANRLGFGSLRELEADVLEASRNQLSEVEYLRARHVLSENHRTLQFVGRLSAQQWQEAGELLYASHASLRDDYAVSCPELDQLVELAKEIGLDGGVFGARMTGGGFGGSVIVLVEKEAVISVATRILELFNQSRSTNQHHATALTTRPSRGAHVI